MLKTLKRGAAASIRMTPLPEKWLRERAARHLTIVAYHRIGDVPVNYPFDENVYSATPEEFGRELSYYRRHLDVLPMSELLAALQTAQSLGGEQGEHFLPERPAVITFDDGYRDNSEVAALALREAGLSACFFLATQIVGTDTIPWWDQVACCFKHSVLHEVRSPFGEGDKPYSCRPRERNASIQRFLHRLKRVPWQNALDCLARLRETTRVCPADYTDQPLFLTWRQVREMAREGMEFGGHTRTHPILSQVSDAAHLHDEITGCHRDLHDQLGRDSLAFAYPVGSGEMMSPEADTEIARAGFIASFSYENGYAPRHPAALTRLPRIHTEYGADFGAFRLGIARAPLP